MSRILTCAVALGLLAVLQGPSSAEEPKPEAAEKKAARLESVKDVAALGLRTSYYKNGRLYVNVLGTPEGKPITTPPEKSWQDFKPSWSKTGDMLVFFRRVKDDKVVSNWRSAICVVKTDGTGFHQLSDGTHADFNQTWTRDGKNTPVWNRQNAKNTGYIIMASKVDAKPGEEYALSDKAYHNWVYTCLKDGRMLVMSVHPTQGWGYFLMAPKRGGGGTYERIDCAELDKMGLLDRITLSPSEKKITFEHQIGHKHDPMNRALFVADFDVKTRKISNVKPVANAERKPGWFAYPRWVKGDELIAYHAHDATGASLRLYRVSDGKTVRASPDPKGDYRYPHGAGMPK